MKKSFIIKISALLLVSIVLSVFQVISVPAVTGNQNYFCDVDNNAWYYNTVQYCYKYGYMSGTGDAVFSPDKPLTRAMFVTILYNISDAKETYAESSFADVKTGAWYFNTVEWAYRNGFTAGTGSDKNGKLIFGTDLCVTREMLAQFLYSYTKKMNESNAKYDITSNADLSSYIDKNNIDAWAFNAMKWAVTQQFLAGTSKTTLSPRNDTSRAQIATVIAKYVKAFCHNWNDGEVIVDRTCTQEGQTKFTCSDCDAERIVKYKAWHTYDVTSTVAPTCTANGSVTYKCRDCNYTYSKSLPALNHSYNHDVCSRCNYKKVNGNWHVYSLIYDDNSEAYAEDTSSVLSLSNNSNICIKTSQETFNGWFITEQVDDEYAIYYVYINNELSDVLIYSFLYDELYLDAGDYLIRFIR